jgi:hypothetical protein
MRFRTGLFVGLAVGYYYGARAGRERYEQIEAWLDRLRAMSSVQRAQTRVTDGVREGSVAARRMLGEPGSAPRFRPRQLPLIRRRSESPGDPRLN